MIEPLTLNALAAELDELAESTQSRVGIDFEADLPAMDSSESEDYGYYLATVELAARLRSAGAAADSNSGDVYSEVVRLLKVLADIEGTNAVGDAAEDALDLLREAASDPADPASPNALLDLAGRAAYAATGLGAATSSILFPVPGTSATLSVADVSGYLRQAAEIVR